MAIQLLRQIRLLDPTTQTDRIADVLLQNGVIQAIETQIQDPPTDAEILDQPGLILGTGLVDLYSRSGEPGNESRETLTSLLNSAAAGGFTQIAILPTTLPAIDNPATVEWFRSKAIGSSPSLLLWGALTHDAKGEQMTELAELAAAGIVGFADGRPINHPVLLRRILEYAQPLGKAIALWPCDTTLRGDGVVREGPNTLRFGLPGTPPSVETAPLSALLELVEATGTPVHLMRISTARSVELIAAAKSRGLPITASTPWMHLLLSTRDLGSYDPAMRVEPPLGNPSDQKALIQGVREGVIDAIAIDHAPYAYEEKTVAFAEAPPGAIGLELALPLLWQRLVGSGELSALTLWGALSTHPARILGLDGGAIAPNIPANLTLFDPSYSWKVLPQTLRSLSYNTPWLGEEILGKVVRIWSR
jgi:dihydroorotase